MRLIFFFFFLIIKAGARCIHSGFTSKYNYNGLDTQPPALGSLLNKSNSALLITHISFSNVVIKHCSLPNESYKSHPKIKGGDLCPACRAAAVQFADHLSMRKITFRMPFKSCCCDGILDFM